MQNAGSNDFVASRVVSLHTISLYNERFHFNHLPLGKKFRNFLEVDIRFDEEFTNIMAKIVPVSTDIFKDHVWED